MSVDFLATEIQYLHHLLPVAREMKESRVLIPRELISGNVPRAEAFLGKGGLVSKLRERTGPVVVCSYKDFLLTDQSDRSVIFMEHGSGQSYSSDHTSYVGGKGRKRAAAILSPGEISQVKNSQAYLGKICLAPGSPRLDDLLRIAERESGDCVAISFHWDCTVCPETRSGFQYYKSILPFLAKKYRLLVHSHPRISTEVRAFCIQNGLEYEESFEEVIRRSQIYICDNSSTIFEWAALGRPVLLLNCPYYRKFVRHGLRFWDFDGPAMSVERPEAIEGAVDHILQNKTSVVLSQSGFVEKVYNNLGTATKHVVEILSQPQFYKEVKQNMPEEPAKIPSIMMKGLKRFEDAEGSIYVGVEFHPGWFHKAFLEGPKRHDIKLIPIAPIPGINEENRASQLEQRGLAERITMPDQIQMITTPVGGVFLKSQNQIVTVRNRLAPTFNRGSAAPAPPKVEIKTVSTTPVVDPDAEVGIDDEEEINVIDHPESKKAPEPDEDKMVKGAQKTNKMANSPEETKTSKKRNPRGVRYSS